MITGNMPAANSSFSEIILYHLNEMPIKEVDGNKDLPDTVRNFLKHCLCKDADKRYASAVEIRNDFLSAGETIRTDKESFIKKGISSPMSLSDKIATIDLKLKSFSIPERVKRLTKILVAIFVLILFFVLIYLAKTYFSKEKLVQPEKEKKIQPITSVKKIAILNRTLIPSDIVDLETELISESYDYLIFRSESKLYIYDVKAKMLVGTISFLRNRLFLGTFSAGGKDSLMFLDNNYSLLFIDFNQNELRRINIEKKGWKGGWFNDQLNYLFLYGDNFLDVYFLEGFTLKKICSYEINALPSLRDNNENYLALLENNSIFIYGIKECSFRRNINIGENKILALRLHKTKERLAVGGWFDRVIIYDFKSQNQIFEVKYPGKTVSMEFLYDKPTLLILKEATLYFCNIPEKKCEIGVSAQVSSYYKIKFQSEVGKLYLLNREPSEIYSISYSTSNKIEVIPISPREIWTLASFPPDYYILGGASHILYVFHRESRKITSWGSLHSQGITRLIQINNLLLSSSDDKMLKISFPIKQEVVKSIAAHTSLINDIYYDKERNIIYTVSSDGALKKWSLPNLELLAEIKNFPSLATVYVSKNEDLVSLGSWENMLIIGKINKGKWEEFARFSIDSGGIYAQCIVPSANLLFLVGVKPSKLYLYDLKSQKLINFNFIPSEYFSCQTIDDNLIVAVGSGFIALINFQRTLEDDLIKYEASLIYYLDGSFYTSADYNKLKKELAIGTSDGKIILVPSYVLLQQNTIIGNI